MRIEARHPEACTTPPSNRVAFALALAWVAANGAIARSAPTTRPDGDATDPRRPALVEAVRLDEKRRAAAAEGKLADAVEWARQAADRRRQARGPQHPEYAAALVELGRAC